MMYRYHCMVCGKAFITNQPHQKTCSHTCADCLHSNDSNKNRKTPKQNCICAVCAKPFKGAYKTSRFCETCRTIPYKEVWERERASAAAFAEENKRFILTASIPHCRKCKMPILPDSGVGNYCSLECAGIAREPTRHGEIEDYTAKQRRENPKKYADGRRLDEILGIRK